MFNFNSIINFFTPQQWVVFGMIMMIIVVVGWKLLSKKKPRIRISGFMTCVYGLLLCLLIGWTQWVFNWAYTPPGKSLYMGIIVFLIAYIPGFFMPGGWKTPTNFERLWGVMGLANINVTITAGPTWQPWFLLIWTMTSIKDKRSGSIGKDDDGVQIVPNYFIFAGRRLLLPDELGEEITDVTTTKAPEVISADNVGVKIPISGDYIVKHNFRFATPEGAEKTLQGEVLASLRSTAAKFAYVDIVRMKTVVTSLVSGKEAVLVMREHDEHGDKGHIMDDKFGAPLFLKLAVPFEIGVETSLKKSIKPTATGILAEKIKKLKRTLVENYNKGRQPDAQKTQDSLEDDGVFELVYTATNLVCTALDLGVEITSIQTRNATPIDGDILKAGAGIEKEKLDKVAGVIRAKGAAASAKELHAALDGKITAKEAMFIDRVHRKLATEQVIRGEGDAIQQLIAAIKAGRT